MRTAQATISASQIMVVSVITPLRTMKKSPHPHGQQLHTLTGDPALELSYMHLTHETQLVHMVKISCKMKRNGSIMNAL